MVRAGLYKKKWISTAFIESMAGMIIRMVCLLLLISAPVSISAQYDNEVSLYDSKGRPVAYVADDLTIYLWSGKPVAYPL